MEGHATQEWGQGSSRPPPQPQQHCHCPCLDLLCKLPHPVSSPGLRSQQSLQEAVVTTGILRVSEPWVGWAPFKLPSAYLGPRPLLPLRGLLVASLLLRLLVPPTSQAPPAHSSQGSPQAEVPFVSFNFGLKENTMLAQTSVPAAPEPFNPLLHRMKGR